MKLQAAKTQLRVAVWVTLSFVSSIGFTQNFNQYFKRENSNTFLNGVTSFNDSIIGVANYFIGSSDVIELIVFSDSGKILFSKKKTDVNNYNYIGTKNLKKINDNLFAMAYTFDSASVGIKGKLLLYDKKKDKINTKTYFTPKKSGFDDFSLNDDGSLLLFGTSTEFDPNGDFYVVHIGKNGEFISDTSFGNTNLAERGYSITTTSDGGFAFTGSRRVTVSGQPYRSKIVVYKFDSLGALEWTNQYGGDLLNFPYQIKSAENGNIYIVGVGSTIEITDDFFDNSPQIISLTMAGNIVWDSLLTLPPDSTNTFYQEGEATNIFIEEGNDYLFVTGYYYSFFERDNINANPSFLMKYDVYGNEIWRRYLFNNTFSNSNSNTRFKFYSLEPTQNGGFLLGGTINGKAPDPVGQYGWIVKTDSLGCVVPGCHLVGVKNNNGHIANNFLVYPNPSQSNQNTWLSFALPKTEAVSIEILNLNGQFVKVQNFGLLPQGNHQIQMDITLAGGIYFLNLQTETFTETVKLVVE